MNQSDRIAKARMGVILSAPFFGSLLMRMPMVRDDSVETFCTNGKVIRYNEKFAASLPDGELRGVLVHEVCHCAQGHLWRMGERNPRRWNVATDYAVNNMLEEYVKEEKEAFENRHGSGRITSPWELPKGGCVDPQYSGMASEDIYNRLPGEGDGAGGAPSGAAAKSAGCGQFTAPATDPDGTSTEGDWQVAVTQAAAVAKMRGMLPASIARLVGELLEPKVPWREVLREFVRSIARDDYTWTRPNRRYLSSGFILPSLRSERMGRLAIGVDTSGSIDDRTLSEFQAEIQSALDECAPESIEVIYCDAQVNSTEEFRPGDIVKLTPQGGGGTRFEPVFEHVEQSGEERPAALIYLTDLCGSFPNQEPAYPVLWAAFGGGTEAPFGQVLAVS